jgi:hypothetical protein
VKLPFAGEECEGPFAVNIRREFEKCKPREETVNLIKCPALSPRRRIQSTHSDDRSPAESAFRRTGALNRRDLAAYHFSYTLKTKMGAPTWSVRKRWSFAAVMFALGIPFVVFIVHIFSLPRPEDIDKSRIAKTQNVVDKNSSFIHSETAKRQQAIESLLSLVEEAGGPAAKMYTGKVFHPLILRVPYALADNVVGIVGIQPESRSLTFITWRPAGAFIKTNLDASQHVSALSFDLSSWSPKTVAIAAGGPAEVFPVALRFYSPSDMNMDGELISIVGRRANEYGCHLTRNGKGGGTSSPPDSPLWKSSGGYPEAPKFWIADLTETEVKLCPAFSERP